MIVRPPTPEQETAPPAQLPRLGWRGCGELGDLAQRLLEERKTDFENALRALEVVPASDKINVHKIPFKSHWTLITAHMTATLGKRFGSRNVLSFSLYHLMDGLDETTASLVKRYKRLRYRIASASCNKLLINTLRPPQIRATAAF